MNGKETEGREAIRKKEDVALRSIWEMMVQPRWAIGCGIVNFKKKPTQDESTIMKLAVALVVVQRTGESWFAACDCSAAVAARLGNMGKAEEEEKAF